MKYVVEHTPFLVLVLSYVLPEIYQNSKTHFASFLAYFFVIGPYSLLFQDFTVVIVMFILATYHNFRSEELMYEELVDGYKEQKFMREKKERRWTLFKARRLNSENFNEERRAYRRA